MLEKSSTNLIWEHPAAMALKLRLSRPLTLVAPAARSGRPQPNRRRPRWISRIAQRLWRRAA